ncbi:MAG: hypothetical protein ACM3ZE_06205, partial [Myxococcales bacterium]
MSRVSALAPAARGLLPRLSRRGSQTRRVDTIDTGTAAPGSSRGAIHNGRIPYLEQPFIDRPAPRRVASVSRSRGARTPLLRSGLSFVFQRQLGHAILEAD